MTPFSRNRIARSLIESSLLVFLATPIQAQYSLRSYQTPAYLGFNQPKYAVSETETNAVVTIVRTGEFRLASTVELTTRDGSATAGADYQSIHQTVYFPAGAGFATVAIPILKDALVEGDETVTLVLSNPDPNSAIVAGQASLVITDSASVASAPANFRLAVKAAGQGLILLQWPTACGNCVLEKSLAPNGPDWQQVAATPTQDGDNWTVTVPVEIPQAFFRLRQTASQTVANN